MRRKTKKWLTVGLLALAIIGGTWAYLTSEAHIDNRLSTKGYGSTISEEFTPRDDWQPGQKVGKVFTVKNTGEYDLVVRVKIEETWSRNGVPFKTLSSTANDSTGLITELHQDNANDGLVAKDSSVVEKDISNLDSIWTPQPDGYWYYKHRLPANAETEPLLRSITLLKDADMGKYDVTSYYHEGTSAPAFEPNDTADDHTATGGWQVFTGAVPKPSTAGNKIFTRTVSKLDASAMGYANADYTLTITAETCQATKAAVEAEWKNESLGSFLDAYISMFWRLQ